VEYEALPGTRYDQVVFKLRTVLGALNREENRDFKNFREAMRQLGLWEKDKLPTCLSLVDLSWDKRAVQIGKLAQRLNETSDDQRFRDLLFQRLKEANVLLVKYVLEALDVESGGRLHSVHELYRMVTSYVYPGKYITLTNFQAWMDWLAASGYVKLIGIRWALSELGQKAVGELKAMDLEEILEDLGDEQGAGAEAPAAEVPVAQRPLSVVPSPAPEKPGTAGAEPTGVTAAAPAPGAAADQPAPKAARGEPEEEAWDDMPPEPAPPSDAEIAAAQSSFEAQFADVQEPMLVEPERPLAQRSGGLGQAPRVAVPASPEPSRPLLRPVPSAPAQPAAPMLAAAVAPLSLALPLATPRGAVGQAVVGAEADPAALAARIIAWWEDLGDWPVFTAPDLMVEVADPEAASDQLLLELALLALVTEGFPPQPQLFTFVQRVRDADLVKKLWANPDSGAAVDDLAAMDREPWTRPLVERLVHARGIARRLAARPGFLHQLQKAPSGKDAVLRLWRDLYGESWVEAPFWVLRELARLRVVTRPEVLTTAVVPTRRLLQNAFRVGLIPSPTPASMSELIAAVEAIARVYGSGSGYGEALEVMDRALGLTTW
jgi:hypothetical protein